MGESAFRSLDLSVRTPSLGDVRMIHTSDWHLGRAFHQVGLHGAQSAYLDHLVEVVGALEDTTRHKPEPDPLLEAARRLGIDPASAVYVGDATVDVLAAQAAGMAAVAVTWGAGERDALVATGPQAVFDSVGELTAYLLDGTTGAAGAGE